MKPSRMVLRYLKAGPDFVDGAMSVTLDDILAKFAAYYDKRTV